MTNLQIRKIKANLELIRWTAKEAFISGELDQDSYNVIKTLADNVEMIVLTRYKDGVQ